MGQAAFANEAPWIAPFEEELKRLGTDEIPLVLGNILKEFLLSDDDGIMIKTARRIEDFYKKEFFKIDPKLRRQDKQGNDLGMEDFLFSFYEVFFSLARFIPYNTSTQQKLLLLLLQLRKQPAKAVKMLDKQCLVWSREPVLGWELSGHWDTNHPRDYKNKIGEGKLKKECDEWINFTTLLARCIEAGVIAEYEFRWELCCMDINKALERDLPHGIRRDCLLMGAAQYVLLAGRTLSVDCYKDPFEEMEGWFAGGYVEGPVRWRRWADRFKEISREENGNPRIASVTKQAHEHMVSLHPELFGDDDDVAIEEPGDDHKDG